MKPGYMWIKATYRDGVRRVDGVLHPFSYSQWNVDSGERLSWLEIYSIDNDQEASPETFAKPAG
jgi:hypothetical protein